LGKTAALKKTVERGKKGGAIIGQRGSDNGRAPFEAFLGEPLETRREYNLAFVCEKGEKRRMVNFLGINR